ncbi:unnamed protein product [Pseudo-nitzschia multistriata]|uniref:Kinesin light chain n=1 Tax=Pseudo-nitzschia multistriata TaxID=183589 RepID=A0A448Z4N4_9STRA|nr:unnamed protein product [Pseudo-nitzschia multistriata]
MYASRVTPVQRMRTHSSTAIDTTTNSYSGYRRSSSMSTAISPTMSTSTAPCMSPTASSVSRTALDAAASASSASRRSSRSDGAGNRTNTSSVNNTNSRNSNMNGDYHVLKHHVELARSKVHAERVDLAEKLDELGEHHVRRNEYEEAMDAFTEALREKRSVFWNIGNCNVRNLPNSNTTAYLSSSGHPTSPRRKGKHKNSNSNSQDDHTSDNASAFSSSLLSGISTNYGGSMNTVGERDNRNDDEEEEEDYDHNKSCGENRRNTDTDYAEHIRVHDATIDALVQTLRNIGNVHSLRGEQDEAMRYFTEVTTLRAQKLSNESLYESNCQDADDASVETRSFLSGLGGHSAISTEQNNSSVGDSASAFSFSAFGSTNSAAATTNATEEVFKGTGTTGTGTATRTSNTANNSGEENPALMSEINEDVRALDDLFRSISFRQGTAATLPQGLMLAPGAVASEKRKSRSSSRKSKKHKRGKSQTNNNIVVNTSSTSGATEAALFVREGATAAPTVTAQTGPASPSSASNSGGNLFLFAMGPVSNGSSEASQALNKYRSTLDLFIQEDLDSSKLRPHQEKMNSFALRIDLQQTDDCLPSSSKQKTNNPSETRGDLELALEIYRQVLTACKEVSNLSPSTHKDLNKQISMPLQTSSSGSSCSSKKQQQHHQQQGLDQMHGGGNATKNSASQSILSMCSAESSASSSVFSSESFSSESSALAETGNNYRQRRRQSKRERRQQLAANIASVLICMGSVYYRLGNRNEELEAYKRAKSVYSKAFGEDHVFVAGTRKNIGMVLAERGQYGLAQKQFEKAMSIYVKASNMRHEQLKLEEKNLHEEVTAGTRSSSNDVDSQKNSYSYDASMNRDVASVISCIGNVKNRVGELNAALTKYLQALQIYKSIYERHERSANNGDKYSDHEHIEALRDFTATLKVIGMVHAKRGSLDTAMQFFEEAMTLLTAYEEKADRSTKDGDSNGCTDAGKCGKNDDKSSTANLNKNSANNMLAISETKASILTRIASIYLKKGALDDAMVSYRRAYDLTVQNRGNTTNHPEIAGILHYIGGIYHKRGEYEEAMSCYQESIRIYHTTLGSDHPTVAGTLVMVGSIHYKRRHLDSAMMFYREALRLNRDAYGIHHPDVAPILKSIGTILTKKGEYHEAYDLFRDVLSVKVTVHGTDHPEVASAYKSLGNVHYKLGELGDAERQYRHALSIYRKSKGDDHPDTIGAKTTIEHLRYWMRERDQQKLQQQQRDQR